ncbi:helix-turn-helix transcriptional regulator [Shouchella patagoniensis]|uniref:helix-turn-helix transcriptional regulator n=1 Tax=Shouchella patagoniensis TaxID=228576 RepID=UPI000995D279|nr:helix-turn-helix transcriptional regulator [Shouchella patagoniensis]
MRNYIKDLRKQHQLSQENLADLVNVSRQTIISIEKGRYNPSLPLAIRIAQSFGTHVENVFEIEEGD